MNMHNCQYKTLAESVRIVFKSPSFLAQLPWPTYEACLWICLKKSISFSSKAVVPSLMGWSPHVLLLSTLQSVSEARTPALIRDKIQFYTHICPYCYCLHYEAISQLLDQAKLLIKTYNRKSHFGGIKKKALHEVQELGIWSQLGHRLAYLLPAIINNINILMFLISWDANWKN